MEKYQVIMQMHEAMCFMDAVPDFVFEAPDERAAMKQAEQIIEHWETGKEISIGFNVNAKRLVSQMASNSEISSISFRNFTIYDESKHSSRTMILPEYLEEVNQSDFLEFLFQRCSARNNNVSFVTFECIAFAVEHI